MRSPADILVLAGQPEKAANLSFLLRLSNLRTIHIADDIEAFNYLVHHQNSSQPISLLLIADADINQPILQLLDELEFRKALLPILLLRSNGPLQLHKLNCHNHVRNYVKQCDPSITHSCVRELLDGLPPSFSSACQEPSPGQADPAREGDERRRLVPCNP
jgi:hypothetical protein